MLNRKSTPFIILGILALSAILIWSVVLSSSKTQLEIIFFDIGQGSAVFIKDSSGNKILIDGGPGNEILNKIARETPRFSRKLNLIVLTHPDSDHLNGALEVLKNYEIAGVLEPCIQDDLSAFKQWQEIIIQRKTKRVCARSGQRIKLADGAVIDILYPFFSLEEGVFSNTNDASIIVRLDYGKNCFLLTGDAPKKIESLLINAGLHLDCEVLQVGHHGSKTSTSQEFLETVSPEIAVISAGQDNRYGHPHQEVLDRLAGVKIYRTDLDGDVEFRCDKTRCQVRSD